MIYDNNFSVNHQSTIKLFPKAIFVLCDNPIPVTGKLSEYIFVENIRYIFKISAIDKMLLIPISRATLIVTDAFFY